MYVTVLVCDGRRETKSMEQSTLHHDNTPALHRVEKMLIYNLILQDYIVFGTVILF